MVGTANVEMKGGHYLIGLVRVRCGGCGEAELALIDPLYACYRFFHTFFKPQEDGTHLHVTDY